MLATLNWGIQFSEFYSGLSALSCLPGAPENTSVALVSAIFSLRSDLL